jgi:hypothetical protein
MTSYAFLIVEHPHRTPTRLWVAADERDLIGRVDASASSRNSGALITSLADAEAYLASDLRRLEVLPGDWRRFSDLDGLRTALAEALGPEGSEADARRLYEILDARSAIRSDGRSWYADWDQIDEETVSSCAE